MTTPASTRVVLTLLAGYDSSIRKIAILRHEWLDEEMGEFADLVLAGHPRIHGPLMRRKLLTAGLEKITEDWNARVAAKGDSVDAALCGLEHETAAIFELGGSSLPAVIATPPRCDLERRTSVALPFGPAWVHGISAANALFDGVVRTFGSAASAAAIPEYHSDGQAWRTDVESRLDDLAFYLVENKALAGFIVSGASESAVLAHCQGYPTESFTVRDLQDATGIDSLHEVVRRLRNKGLLSKADLGSKITVRGQCAKLRPR